MRRSGKRIPRSTPKRARERAKYNRKAAIFKRRYPWCVCCITMWPASLTVRPTSDVHHKAGCEGDLLLDERFWMPVCRWCHDWIESHGRAARELSFVIDKDYRMPNV